MTIAKTIDDMFTHPYWKNEDERRIYLIDLCTHVYQRACEEAAVIYRNNRRYTPTECYNSIKDMAPPTLNFWMKRAEIDCIVVPMTVVHQQKKAGRFFNPFQLILDFPEFTQKEILQA